MDRNPKTKKKLSQEELNTVAGGGIPIDMDFSKTPGGIRKAAEEKAVEELTEAFSNLSLDDDDDD